jgi:iron complex outermembrane receptor protein
MMRTLHYVAVACALTAAIAVPATMSRAAEEPAVSAEAAPAEQPLPSEGTEASEVAAPELLLFQEIPMVVTASRMAEAITEAPASVSVITREQILNSGAISIPDLLRMVPGVDVMQGAGANWEVSIRGVMNPMSNKVLVLIDGRTAYNDFYANVNWYELPVVLEDIERIEVIRGPLSSLWGANASLGVINIITRSPAASQGTLATAQYGTRGTFRVDAIHGGHSAASDVYYKVVAARNEVGQWTPSSSNARKGMVDRDPAGEVTKLTAAAQWSRGGADWNLSAGRSDGGVGLFIDYSTTQRLWEETTNYASLSYERGDLNARAYWNGSRIAYSDTSIGTAIVYTDLYDLELLKSQAVGRHNLLYGAAYRHKELGEAGVSLLDGSHRQSLWAAYVEDAYRPSPKTKLVLGGRYDDHPLAGVRLSGRATVMCAVAPDQSLRLSAASAFRSPSFLESYLEVVQPLPPPLPPAGVWGNTELEPEKISGYDVGYRLQLAPRTSAELGLYCNKLDDFILYNYILEVPPQQQFQNLGSAVTKGAEIEVRHSFSPRLSGFANYSYQKTSGSEELMARHDTLVKLAPTNKANIGLNITDPDAGLNGSLLLNYRDKVVVGSASAGPYVLVNGYVGKKIGTDGREIGISFFNLANYRTQQFPKGDYIGRRIMGSVRWEF